MMTTVIIIIIIITIIVIMFTHICVKVSPRRRIRPEVSFIISYHQRSKMPSVHKTDQNFLPQFSKICTLFQICIINFRFTLLSPINITIGTTIILIIICRSAWHHSSSRHRRKIVSPGISSCHIFGISFEFHLDFSDWYSRFHSNLIWISPSGLLDFTWILSGFLHVVFRISLKFNLIFWISHGFQRWTFSGPFWRTTQAGHDNILQICLC